MIKKYISPEIKISMFDVECISTTDGAATVLSQPVYGNNLNNYIQNKQNSVQKNLDFNKAIEFN